MTSARLVMASSMPCMTQLRRPLASPASHWSARVGAGDGGGHALEYFDVEDGGRGGYADDLSGAGADGCGGEGGSPGAVARLILGGAVIAGGWVGGLVDFSEVEGEVGGYVGMGLVDAAVDDGDADAFAHGGVPGAVRGAAGDVVAVAADLLDGPALGGVCSRCRMAGAVVVVGLVLEGRAAC